MANILGQLLVELGINTAAFKSGTDKATYQAKAAAKEIKEAFSGVGDSLRGLGSAFGEVGAQIGAAAGKAADFVEAFAGMSAPIAGVAAIGAAAAGAGLAAIGAAVHFSETAAKLHELSQSTGVAVEDLSVLGGIAATKGVAIESMASALQKMDTAALKAAQSGPKVSNAFKDLGISVTNSDGTLRSSKDIFNDVAVAFSKMEDGALKTAEARKIFGKSGAELIPLLDTEGSKMAELEGHMRALGAVVDGPTAKASADLKEQMSLMGDAFTGIENQLTKDLVPALTVVAKEFVSFFEDNQAGISSFLDGVANISKVFINVFQVIGDLLADFFNAFMDVVEGMQSVFLGLGNAMWDAAHGDFHKAWDDIKQGARDVKNGVVQNFKQMVSDIKNQGIAVAKVWTEDLPKEVKPKARGEGSPNASADTRFVDNEVAGMERLAQKEANLAFGIGQETTARIEAMAAAESHAAQQKLLDEAISKGIENTKAFQAALAAAIPRLNDAATWTVTFKEALKTAGEFDNFDKKIKQQVASLEEEAKQSSVVERQWAKNMATLEPLKDSLKDLTDEYNKLHEKYGDDNPRVQELAANIEQLNKQLVKETGNVQDLDAAFQALQAANKAKELDAHILKLTTDIDTMNNGDGFINIAEQLQAIKAQVGPLTDDQMSKLKAQLQEIKSLQITQAVGKKKQSLGFDPEKVNQLREEINQLNADFEKGKIPQAEYEQTFNALNKDLSDAEAKTGTWQTGIKASFADLAANTKTFGETMREVVDTGLKGVTDNFAQMVTTGKSSWQSLITSMEQALIRSSLNSLISHLFSGLTGGGGGGILGSIFGGLTGHAFGGNLMPGQSYIVGEKGPEVFTPDKPGAVTPNSQIGDMSGGAHIEQHFHINTPDADSFKKSQAQIMAQGYALAQMSHARNR